MAAASFASVIKMMTGMPDAIETEIQSALRKAVVQVQKTAVEKFGRYQPQVGEFEAWAVLSPEYLKQKLATGAGGDDPLIGHAGRGKDSVYPTPLRQSVGMEVGHLEGQVGTNDPLGEWHEYGYTGFNVRYPPRPWLRPALFQNEEWIKSTMKEAIGMGMVSWFK